MFTIEGLTQERLKQLLYYNPEIGTFRWLRAHARRKLGDRAGVRDHDGGRRIRIDGRMYNENRLAWLYVHGRFPDFYIDHVNGIRDDNRIANLRPASGTENRANSKLPRTNTSGFKGVCLSRKSGKWRAKIQVRGQSIHLGEFDRAADAGAAYSRAADQYFGEYARLK